MECSIIIVEDEFHSANMLEAMIKDLKPEWHIKGVFDSVADTVDWLTNNEHPNIIFLDIQLSDGLSFSIFEKVKVESAIVFTTAFDEYAVKAFQLNSIDYILKPVKKDLLKASIDKFEKLRKILKEELSENVIDYKSLLEGLKKGEPTYRKRFLVSRRDAFFSIPVEDVAYVYFESKLTYVVTFDSNEYAINFTLDKLEEELNPDLFMRINRQAIVNMNAIHSLENYFGGKLVVKLLTQFDEKYIVSRAKASAIKQWLDN